MLQTVTNNAQVNGVTSDIIVANQYNAYGQVVKQTMPYATTVWNGSGSPYRSPTFAADHTVVTTYDNAGRVTSVTPPTANNAVVYSYPDDLTVKVVNGNGNSTVTRSDIFGRVVETRNYNNLNDQVDPWLRYTYDAADRLLSVDKRYGAGDGSSFALTNMSYDMVGRKLAMTDMDMGSWQYRYDALGNLTSQTDARSCTTTLLYNDGLSRLTNKNYSGACTTTLPVSYGYDSVTNGNKGKGKRTSMSDGSGSTTWFYGDARGRLTREVKSITGSGVYTTQWEYDVADQVIGVTYPDNEYVTFGYLPQMLVNAVNGGAYVQSTQYDAAGRVELRELGSNQIRTDYNYYPWDNQGGRLQWLRSGVPFGGGVNPTLQNFTYNYDPNGNVMSIADALAGGTQTQSFSYDNLDRLFTASATGGTGGLYSQSYNYYSSDGRMLNGPAGTNYDYADASHPHAVTTAGANSYAYDFNGNMITRTVGSTTYVQSYDAENRLVSVTGGTVPATFVYDGDNNRVRGTIGNVVTVYVGNLYEVRNGMVKKYYYAGNQRVAMRDSGTLYWLLGDHLGSTAYTINGTTEVAEVRHRPWGQNRFVFGTTPTTYRYTGQREESSIGLYYYGARWYDPALGRFIQPDTIVPNPGDAQAFDRYAYVLNNPLRYSDPTGHYSNDEIMDHLGCNDWTCVESMFGSDGQYAGLWGWLYILQQANDGDAIVSSQGRYTTNQTTTAAGVFQRSSAGEIQIIYGNGNISFAEPGAIMSERLFAYAGSSGRTPSGFTYGYYSLQNGNGRQIAGTSSTRQNKYLYIDPQEVFLTGLKAGKDIGPVVAGAAVATGPAAPFVAAAGGIYTAVGYGTWVLTDVVYPASQLVVDHNSTVALEAFGTNVLLPRGVEALGYSQAVPYVGTAYDISKMLYGACYGTGCPR